MNTVLRILILWISFSVNDVSGVNEFAPVVQWPTFNVLESAPIGTLIGKCTITDGDEPHGTLAGQTAINFLKPNISAVNKWILDRKSCEFYLNHKLDYGTKKFFQLNVVATDLDPVNPRTSQGKFTINVLEAQDQPTCTEYLKVVSTVKSAGVGTPLTTVTCEDNDAGVNGQLTYELDAGNKAETLNIFGVTTTTGSLHLKSLITSDTIPFYEVLIKVKDGGSPSMSNYVLVRVIVTDIPQDGVQPTSLFANVSFTPMAVLPAPIDLRSLSALPKSSVTGQLYCPRYALTAVIPETKKANFFVHNLKCTEPSGNTPTYIIEKGNVFTKFKTDGPLLKLNKGLNADFRNHFYLRIRVTDSTATFSTTVTVAAHITGVNDNPPKFKTPNPTIEVDEDKSIGTIVHTCVVTDKDKSTNPEGQVRFSWQNPDDSASKHWIVDPVTCSIYIARKLDYETTPTYVLNLRGVDLDPTSPMSAVNSITFNIKDVNEPPECSPINPPEPILRDAPATTQIASLSCTDPDSGANGNLGYKMDASNSDYINSRFVVSLTGKVSLQSTIDDGSQATYNVVVIAYDGGTPSLSTTVTVPVTVKEAPTTTPSTTTTTTSTTTPTTTTPTTTTTTSTTSTTTPTTTTTTPSTTTTTTTTTPTTTTTTPTITTTTTPTTTITTTTTPTTTSTTPTTTSTTPTTTTTTATTTITTPTTTTTTPTTTTTTPTTTTTTPTTTTTTPTTTTTTPTTPTTTPTTATTTPTTTTTMSTTTTTTPATTTTTSTTTTTTPTTTTTTPTTSIPTTTITTPTTTTTTPTTTTTTPTTPTTTPTTTTKTPTTTTTMSTTTTTTPATTTTTSTTTTTTPTTTTTTPTTSIPTTTITTPTTTTTSPTTTTPTTATTTPTTSIPTTAITTPTTTTTTPTTTTTTLTTPTMTPTTTTTTPTTTTTMYTTTTTTPATTTTTSTTTTTTPTTTTTTPTTSIPTTTITAPTTTTTSPTTTTPTTATTTPTTSIPTTTNTTPTTTTTFPTTTAPTTTTTTPTTSIPTTTITTPTTATTSPTTTETTPTTTTTALSTTNTNPTTITTTSTTTTTTSSSSATTAPTITTTTLTASTTEEQDKDVSFVQTSTPDDMMIPIIGGIAGFVILLTVTSCLIIYFYRKKKRRRRSRVSDVTIDRQKILTSKHPLANV